MPKASDVYAKVTNRIVRQLEDGQANGTWAKPWAALAEHGLPYNASTGKAYQGGNVFALWIEAGDRGFVSTAWATYKQWAALGAQVRKGEKGTGCVKWAPAKDKSRVREDGTNPSKLVPVGFTVFNADQVDGWEQPALPEGPAAIEHAEEFFSNIAADVRHGGDRACYLQAADVIQLPHLAAFTDAESYYATSAHEHVHWTGHSSRLDRTFGRRFGDDAYGVEELVAELGAAFLCAQLGLAAEEPREDHALYLKHWLRVLKADPKALFTAASAASKAVEFLTEKAEPQEVAA